MPNNGTIHDGTSKKIEHANQVLYLLLTLLIMEDTAVDTHVTYVTLPPH